MPRRPAVTVLMSVHNETRYLAEALDSIFAQTLDDIEFLIIDDGSTDGSWEILAALRDPRVRLLRNPRNFGLTASLNRGLAHARGEYVARMDADDIARSDRLQCQVDYLEAHPEVVIVGSSRELIDPLGLHIAHAPAVEDDLGIRWKCLLGNPFAHPTVVLRRELLASHHLRYDERYPTAQDYELWTRVLLVGRGANLSESLVRYRLRDGISQMRKSEQLANHDRIAMQANRLLLPEYPLAAEDIRQLRGRFGGYSVRDPDADPADETWREKYRNLRAAFERGV